MHICTLLQIKYQLLIKKSFIPHLIKRIMCRNWTYCLPKAVTRKANALLVMNLVSYTKLDFVVQ